MTYDVELANRIRGELVNYRKVEEKKMFGFLVFMVNGRMCLGVRGGEMMLRLSPDLAAEAVQRDGCSPLIMKGRASKRMVMIDESVMTSRKDFENWIVLALNFIKPTGPAKPGNTASQQRNKSASRI